MKCLDASSFKTYILEKKYEKYWHSINIVRSETYYIKVSSGCMNNCAYCAVKLSRGDTKSKPISQIKSEFSAGLKSGFTQFGLIGTDCGSYGQDLNTNLIELFRELVAVDGDFNLKVRNVNPQFLIQMLPEFLEIVKTCKIDYMTTAAQHGSNRVLKAMNRGYAIEDFIGAVTAIKNTRRDFKIRTQLMVGFPGETDSDFRDTLALLGKADFDFVEVYKFSARPGTPAFEMRNDLPQRVVNKRFYTLKKKVVDKLTWQA